MEQTAYQSCKADLSSDALLGHYDAKRELQLMPHLMVLER